MDVHLDPAKLDAAERQIDALIDRRGRDAANAEEGLWAASSRRDQERRRQELTEAWAAYHRKMHQLHAALSEEHAEKAEALEGTA